MLPAIFDLVSWNWMEILAYEPRLESLDQDHFTNLYPKVVRQRGTRGFCS